jgi:NAD(P)H-hydrate epimerase
MRLTGQTIPEIMEDVPGQAVRYAEAHGCICVLKDAPTAVGAPDGNCWINTTGNNGMSVGGSGDVLTGIIAGLLGQKSDPLKAALLGVWLHGRAGDLAAEREGTYGLLARHLIEHLPEAMRGDEPI